MWEDTGDGAQGRIRTTDTRIFSPLLYQLSYLGAGLTVRAADYGRHEPASYRSRPSLSSGPARRPEPPAPGPTAFARYR